MKSVNSILVGVATLLVLYLAGSMAFGARSEESLVRVASKPFNESYILAEIMAQLLEARGFAVERRLGLGATMISYEALKNDEIDVYPEYSGTIQEAIFRLKSRRSISDLQDFLLKQTKLELLPSFGFENTYVLAARAGLAREKQLHTISDLVGRKGIRYGLTHEYLRRGDGWQALSAYYGLSANPVGMEHSLSYKAIADGQIDVLDAYSTDAEILKYKLVLLRDDKNFFPRYLAAPFVRQSLSTHVKQVLDELAGRISEKEMQHLNSLVISDGKTFAQAASEFLRQSGLVAASENKKQNRWIDLGSKTLTHLQLTAVAVVLATLLALPLGIYTYLRPSLAKPVIYSTGLLQTIPSLALLAFMIAPFGTGTRPALIALTLYALLPILRNTYIALNSIDPVLRKVSVGMGLTVWQRLRYIELPLGAPTILAGIRTASVITVGTATLAAFIGAGGLGEYIQTGLALNDPQLILWGAVPAALLAFAMEFGFEALEKLLVPKHLLQRRAR